MGEQRNFEQGARATDLYRELFERSADAILVIEGNRFVECNEAAVRMLRYQTREDVFSIHPSQLSPATQPDGRDSFEKANEMMALAFEKGNHRFEWTHLRADGEVFPVEVLLTAVEANERPKLHVVWRDITERKRLEAQLLHSQKIESIGRLAGGIAHDFNNLLVAIMGYSDLLSRQFEADPTAIMRINAIRHAGQSAAALVRQLLAFGRKQTDGQLVFDLPNLVENMASLITPLVGERAEIITSVLDRDVPVAGDPSQIEQIVMNLVTNARDAMERGGVLRIEVARINVGQDDIGRRISLDPGDYALLTVADNGCGMSPSVVQNAFDPFFTTKAVGKGTGLGLSTVYGIAKRFGGGVLIDSAPNEGTVVKVYLPISKQEAGSPARMPDQGPVLGGTETILVVDDQPSVVDLVQTTLVEFGYQVIRAADSRGALEVLNGNAEPVDLLLSDVIMPGMNGPELVHEMRKQGHSPKVLFMSGYTDDALTDRGETMERIELLKKPFSISDLVRSVRFVLDQKWQDESDPSQ